jgi:hypothetical protein
MKRRSLFSLATFLAASLGAMSASAAILVNDTWQDANRTDPTTTVSTGPHSEFGTDADADGDLESVWYSSPAAATSASAGHLVFDNTNGGANTGSSSYTTFFAPDATPVTLAQGETLRVTWVFTPDGVGTNNGRNLRMALVDTAGADRRTTDGSPNNSTYSGYRISLNVAQTLIANTMELRERTQFAADNLLVNDDRWSGGLASVGADGAAGMVNGTPYTFVWSIKRTLADEMQIDASLSGGSYAGTGSLALSFTDASANNGSFSFDTFAMRPGSAVNTANSFDTSLFRVEVIPIPEPTGLALAAVVGAAALFRRRR